MPSGCCSCETFVLLPLLRALQIPTVQLLSSSACSLSHRCFSKVCILLENSQASQKLKINPISCSFPSSRHPPPIPPRNAKVPLQSDFGIPLLPRSSPAPLQVEVPLQYAVEAVVYLLSWRVNVSVLVFHSFPFLEAVCVLGSGGVW